MLEFKLAKNLTAKLGVIATPNKAGADDALSYKSVHNDGKAYIIFEKTGSQTSNHIYKATYAIQSCSKTNMLDAIELNERVKSYLLGEFLQEKTIASVKLNSDYNFTDEITKTYRMQAVFEIVYYNEIRE